MARTETVSENLNSSKMFCIYTETVSDIHCFRSVRQIQEHFHEGANLKLYIPESGPLDFRRYLVRRCVLRIAL
jgi:hypothetical protein